MDFNGSKDFSKNAQSDKKKKNGVNKIIENKSLHSNFKFSSANSKKGKINMFGKKPTGNMAYQSQSKNLLNTISNKNPTIPNLQSNSKIYSEFDLDQYDKNDSIDLMDEDEEDFDIDFDIQQPMTKMKSDIISNNLQKNLNNSKNNSKKNSLLKQLNPPNKAKSMMINRDIIDNSNHTKQSNTSHGSNNQIYINTFGKKRMNFEIPNNKKINEKVETRPKQFTFNNKMVLNSFKNKNSK
jgi:hypothetical protein